MSTSYTVIYRTGGELNFKWNKALPVSSWEEAVDLADSVRKGGRPALIHETEALNRFGLPETFSADDYLSE